MAIFQRRLEGAPGVGGMDQLRLAGESRSGYAAAAAARAGIPLAVMQELLDKARNGTLHVSDTAALAGVPPARLPKELGGIEVLQPVFPALRGQTEEGLPLVAPPGVPPAFLPRELGGLGLATLPSQAQPAFGAFTEAVQRWGGPLVARAAGTRGVGRVLGPHGPDLTGLVVRIFRYWQKRLLDALLKKQLLFMDGITALRNVEAATGQTSQALQDAKDALADWIGFLATARTAVQQLAPFDHERLPAERFREAMGMLSTLLALMLQRGSVEVSHTTDLARLLIGLSGRIPRDDSVNILADQLTKVLNEPPEELRSEVEALGFIPAFIHE